MEIKLNDSGDCQIIQVVERNLDPSKIAVTFQDIYNALRESSGLCLDNEEELKVILNKILSRAYTIC